MPPTKKSNRATPKVFRCSGYGDCQMVFTRSEHLARHMRMHTGEKPFECIVAGCNRKFSRYDNMMQHTRIHERQKKKSSGPATVCAASSAPATSFCASTPVAEAAAFRTPPAPPQRTHGNGNKSMMKVEALLSPPVSQRNQSQQPQHQQQQQQKPMSPPPCTLISPIPQPWQQHQYCWCQEYHVGATPSWSPTLLPEQHFTTKRSAQASDESRKRRRTSSANDEPGKPRRLSLLDLETPIEYWSEHSESEDSGASTPIVEVTSDEYEAILALGRFTTDPHLKPVS